MAKNFDFDEKLVEGWSKDFRDNGRLSTLMPKGWIIDLKTEPATFVYREQKKLSNIS